MSNVKIDGAKNGPLLVKGMKTILMADGTEKEVEGTIALCRCGGSANKPFCDGTHSKNGFSSERETDRSNDRWRDYEGKEIMVHDNRTICSHAEECLKNSPSVFKAKEKPWIVPDAASRDEIIATVKKCPSGALSYTVDGKLYDKFSNWTGIEVTADGPYHVEGAVEIEDPTGMTPPNQDHYALCRCGASKNKPFCDGEHANAGFKDPGVWE